MRNPDITTGYILALGVGTYYDLPAADFFSVESTFITAGMVQQIHLRGKTISAWTINRQQDAEKLLQLGVDDLITDKPEIIAPLLARADSKGKIVAMLDIKEGKIVQAKIFDNEKASLIPNLNQALIEFSEKAKLKIKTNDIDISETMANVA